MSLWNDFWDFVGDTVDTVGDTIHDVWNSVKSNPIGAITSAVAMAYGIPPGWAGALGGAAGAAATGGDIVKAAVTGGAMGYMGGAAGAAAGEAGALAQAAASGAAAGVTGAILTGQDVLTAAKSGLILGTVMYGGQKTFQLMTQQEAINSVPPETLAQLKATSADPMGDLIDKMGWTSSDSAVASASKAFSQNAATTMQMLQDYIPDYVLKDAQTFAKSGGDQNAYIADKMGWELNGTTATASQKAFNNYTLANTPASTSTNPAKQLADTGLVDSTQAKVLTGSGYSAETVKELLSNGYNAEQLVDMASTGVPADTLKTLSNSNFTTDEINGMLSSGNVGANEIAYADKLISGGVLTTDNAQSLLKNNLTTYDIQDLANKGQANSVANLMDNGVSKANAMYMADKGINLAQVNSAIDKGYMTGQDFNNSFSNGTYNNVIKGALDFTPPPPGMSPEDMLHQQETLQAQQVAHQAQLETAQQLADQSGGYLTAQQVIDQHLTSSDISHYKDFMDNLYGKNQPTVPETPTQAPVEPQLPQTQYTDVPGSRWLDQGNGTSVDTHGNIVNSSTGEIIQPSTGQTTFTNQDGTQYHIQDGNFAYGGAPLEPSQPETNLVDVGGGNYMDQSGNITDSQGNITQAAVTPSAPITETAQAPTETTTDTPYRVDVGGSAGFAGNPSSVVNEYRTPETDLATQEQIDNGTAKYNAGANAWEVPTVPEVVVTAPKIEQPITPIIVPPTTTPTTPTQVTGPVTPPVGQTPQVTQPQAPTVVSSSTRTLMDGSVYKDDQMSDGTVSSVLVSGPTGTSTGGGTTGTATPQTPLSPPTQEVIPPGSSYVAPVEVTPPPVTEPPVTEPPVDTTTPIVPMIPPTGTPTLPEDNTRGHYALGEPVHPNIPHTLNPGWITNVPTHYQTTNDAQSQYYWGQHPYQTGTTFDKTLYNQTPNAPQTPFGLGYAQTAATPQQVMQAMKGVYPLLNSVAGPVSP